MLVFAAPDPISLDAVVKNTKIAGADLVHFSAQPEPLCHRKRFNHHTEPAESAPVEPKSGRV